MEIVVVVVGRRAMTESQLILKPRTNNSINLDFVREKNIDKKTQ